MRQLTRRLGARKLKAISLDDLKDYQQERRKTVRERPINLELQILVNVLKEANLWRGTLLHYKRLREPESEVGIALTSDELRQLESVAAKRDTWLVAYCAEILAANTGMRGGEIKKLRMGMIDLENRRIRVTRDTTKTDAGARTVELNQAATEVVCKLFVRAQTLGAKDAGHFLLPADLGAHTKAGDPLKGKHGFDATRHQESWGTAWRNLRKAAGDAIVEKAAKENRELTPDENETVATFRSLRFHTLRHTFVTMMGERGVPLQVVGAMVGHMSPAMVRYYTHISNNAARDAVELLDRERPMTRRPAHVGSLVGSQHNSPSHVSKLLN